jgi:hypothetical protein
MNPLNCSPEAIDGILNADETVAFLKLPSLKSLYQHYARGNLPRSIGPGRLLRFRRSELLQSRIRRASSPKKAR